MTEQPTLHGMRLQKVVLGFCAASIIYCTAALFSSLNQLHLVQNIFSGITVSQSTINTSDTLQRIFGFGSFLVTIPFFVLFLIWFRKAYQNLVLFNGKTAYGSGWAIGGFFVPFLNLVRPYRICKEIVFGSKITPITFGDKLLIMSWWLVFLTSGVTGNILFRSIPKESSTAKDFLFFSRLTVFSDIVSIIEYSLFLLLLVSIILSQNRRLHLMNETAQTTLPDETGEVFPEALQ